MWRVDNEECLKLVNTILDQPKVKPKPKVEHVVSLYREKLNVNVPYDPVLIEEFRKLGVWNVKRRVWEFPLVTGPKLAELNLGDWSEDAKEYSFTDHATALRSKALEAPHVETVRLLRQPKPYQIAGIDYLLHTKQAFLADSIGLGKSFQSIAAIEQVEQYPCLIVCEASMKAQWEREVQLTVERSTVILHGKKPYTFLPADFVIINQDIVDAWKTVLGKYGFQSLIVDESSNFASSSKRSQAVRKVAKTVPGCRFCLTGTAVMNGDQLELVNQLDILGRSKEFGGRTGMRKYSVDDLNLMLKSRCYLRRTTSDVYSDMDTKMVFNTLMTEIDDKEYRLAEKDILDYIGNLAAMFARQTGEDPRSAKVKAMVRAAGAESLVKLMKLRQIVGKQKVISAVAYVEKFLDSTEDEKIILFGFHKDVIQNLVSHLGFVVITGGTSDADRAEAVRRFQNDPLCRGIILNTRSAGKGITLSAASTVLFVESEWSQALMRQCLGRAHMRTDNPHPALGVVMVAPNTIDEWMLDLRRRKAEVSDTIVDGEFDDYEFSDGATQGDMLDMLVDLACR